MSNERVEVDCDGHNFGMPEHLSVGRIMSPEEIRDANNGRESGDVSRVQGHWSLCGDLSEPMFKLLFERPKCQVLHRLDFIEGAKGGMYMVVTTQVETYQHRFVVPLYEEDGLNFLIGLCFNPLALLVGRAGGNQAVVLFPHLDGGALWAYLKGFQPVPPAERVTLGANLLHTVGEVCDLERIRPLVGAVQAQSLSVTTVLPSRLSLDLYRVLAEVQKMRPAFEGNGLQLH